VTFSGGFSFSELFLPGLGVLPERRENEGSSVEKNNNSGKVIPPN